LATDNAGIGGDPVISYLKDSRSGLILLLNDDMHHRRRRPGHAEYSPEPAQSTTAQSARARGKPEAFVLSGVGITRRGWSELEHLGRIVLLAREVPAVRRLAR
jgi:hypothetical protein